MREHLIELCDQSHNIKCMVGFLNHAYNGQENELSDEIKLGGALFFAVLEDKINALVREIENNLALQ